MYRVKMVNDQTKEKKECTSTDGVIILSVDGDECTVDTFGISVPMAILYLNQAVGQVFKEMISVLVRKKEET